MPLYTFKCDCGEVYDRLSHYDDVTVAHSCGQVATRESFYGGQNTVGDSNIPTSEQVYKDEATRKELDKKGHDYSWALEYTHDHMVETDRGKIFTG